MTSIKTLVLDNIVRRIEHLLDPIYSVYPLSKGQGLIVVAGMPKSGTTAIAKLLGAATGQAVCSDPFHRLDVKRVEFREALFDSRLSLESLWRRHRRVFSGKIIKDPNFPLLLDQVKTLFPEAQFVAIVRDPRDNLRSILNRLGLPGNPGIINLDAEKIPRTWHNILTGQVPKLAGVDYIETLAWRWRWSAEAFLKQRPTCIEIRYEDFRKDKSQQIENLAKRLGFSKLLDIHHLLDVQFQPKGNDKVVLSDFFGAEQLQKIEKITGPLLQDFGYAPR